MTPIQRSQRAEMALIKGDDPPCSVLPCCDDHAQVCEPNVEIVVATFQVCHETVVVRLHMGDNEPPGGQVIEEREREPRPSRRPSR